MKNHKRIFVWFVMLTKRLMCRIGFLSLLTCIILASWLFSAASSDGGNITRVALYSAGDNISANTIQNLSSEKSIISFEKYDSEEEAIRSVEIGKTDSAWIFGKDFKKKLEAYLESESMEAPILIVQREDSVALKLSREKLFCGLYPDISYLIFENFVRDEIDGASELSNSDLKNFYKDRIDKITLINIKTVGSDSNGRISQANMLTSPLRGFLALAVMICTLASVLYFVDEKERGKYAHLPCRILILPAGASCLGAGVLSGTTALISVWLSGLSCGLCSEIISMTAYVWAAASMCTVFAVAFESPSVFGALIPFFAALVLLVCPIFFNMNPPLFMKLLIPTYHYLKALCDMRYIVYMIIYGFAGFGAACAVSYMKNGK